jgi:hypothetical protein
MRTYTDTKYIIIPVYIHLHICKYINIYAYRALIINVHIYTCIHVFIHVTLHVDYACVISSIRLKDWKDRICIYTYIYVHTYSYVHKYIYIYIYIYTYIYIYMYVYTYISTCVISSIRLKDWKFRISSNPGMSLNTPDDDG